MRLWTCSCCERKILCVGELLSCICESPFPHPVPLLPTPLLSILCWNTGLEMRSKSLCFKRFGICLLATTPHNTAWFCVRWGRHSMRVMCVCTGGETGNQSICMHTCYTNQLRALFPLIHVWLGQSHAETHSTLVVSQTHTCTNTHTEAFFLQSV